MKTQNLFFTMLIAAAVPAWAAPNLSHLPSPGSAREPRKPVSGCADFSGKWQGPCSNGTSAELDILQSGCSYLTVGSQSYYVGGLHTESDYIPRSASIDQPIAQSSTRLIQWGEDNKTLHISESWYATNQGANPTRLDFTGFWRREGDELHSHLDPDVDCHLKK